jgi:hypothetical protein
MAKGTDFGGVHSFYDLNLIQQLVDEQPAEPKLNLIDIPGADGSVDMSELPGGRLVYKDRTLTWTFALYPGENWDAKHRQVSNALNGKRCRITLDTNPDYYYDGRVAVKKYNKDKLLRQITVEAICNPWMLKQQPTVVRAPIGFELSWDGDVSGIISASGSDGTFYHISDQVIPLETIFGGGRYTWVHRQTGESTTVDFDSLLEYSPEVYLVWGTLSTYAGIIVATEDGKDLYGVTLPKKGIYFIGVPDVSYVSSVVFKKPDRLTVNLLNDRKPVVPQITCAASDTTVEFNGGVYKLNAGTHQILDIELIEGDNAVTVSGQGAVIFTYQEGSL